jgi:hypothetical protein
MRIGHTRMITGSGRPAFAGIGLIKISQGHEIPDTK